MNKKEYLDYLFRTINGKVHPVDLKNGDLYILIEVYRDMLMFSIVPKYKEYKRFNLQ